MGFSLKEIPLPKNWASGVKAGVLHAISLAHLVTIYARGWAANSCNARIRLAAELKEAKDEISRLQEEIRIKDSRMVKIDPQCRPHYPATERMSILELKAIRGWSQVETARRFLVMPTTIASWLKRDDEKGPSALVRVGEPVNRFPDFVRYIVRRLKVLCPTFGKVRIAQILARAGLHIGVTTVRRMLKERPDSEPARRKKAESGGGEGKLSGRVVTSYRPNHIWLVDLTTMPTMGGFWVPWMPRALYQAWPVCWWIAVVVDHFSRRVMGITVFKTNPTSVQVRTFLGRVIGRAGATPKYVISDQGQQFIGEGHGAWCDGKGIRWRYGAVGQHGSIAVAERFIRSFKEEFLRRIIISLRRENLREQIGSFISWFNEYRPHQGLGGRTPEEVYCGKIPANEQRRFEPRRRWPKRSLCAAPQARTKDRRGVRIELNVIFYNGHRSLPIVELNKAA